MAKRKINRVKRPTKSKSKRNFNDPAYIAWRGKVYKRDGKKCQWPDCKEKRFLNAHHIRRWADYPHLRFEVSNGITLCKHHHKSIHNKELTYAPMFHSILQKQLLEKLRKLHGRDNKT